MLSALLKFLFPSYCVSCKRLGSEWCESCRASIVRSAFHDPNVLVATQYTDIMASAIHAWKYEYAEWLSSYFAELIVRHSTDVFERCDNASTVFVPVPITKRKQRQRGYNQSELLARELTKRTYIPTQKLLAKPRETTAQVGLSKIQRTENLNGAFDVRKTTDANTLILIDDVLTTGATIQECSQVLKNTFPHATIKAVILSSKKN